ncbi:MAG: recombinase RecT [Thiotrichales bacterium]|nr:recombinase RecT [Thiotrichales bacterium]
MSNTNEISIVEKEIFPEIESLLPSHIKMEKFISICQMAAMINPQLRTCTKDSLAQAFLRCAKDGLYPDGKDAAIVIYSKRQGSEWVNAAQYQPMIDGILKRLRLSGEVLNIIAKPVYEADSFDYYIDIEGEKLKYHPNFSDANRGQLKLVFAMAKMASGETVVEVMSKEDVDKIMYMSKSAVDSKTGAIKQNSVWFMHYERMAIKTVIHRIARRLPNASEVIEMLERDINVKSIEEQVNPGSVVSFQERVRDFIGQDEQNYLSGLAKSTSTDINAMFGWVSAKTGSKATNFSEVDVEQYAILTSLLEKKQKDVIRAERENQYAQEGVIDGQVA